MRKTDYIIGLDVGTSSVKSLAFSKAGKLLNSKKFEYKVISSAQDRMEHDARLIYQETVQCIKALMQAMGHPPLALGIDTFMHSIMPVDDKINPLGNLLLWNDNRSASVARSLKKTIEGREMYTQTGTPVHPMSWLTKIKWIKENDPETFNRARYFIGIKEYILYHLTGELVLDYSTASSTGLLNSIQKHWHKEALDWCGITLEQLPGLVDSTTLLISQSVDLKKKITIIPGLSDGCAANLGASSMSPSDLTLTLGTSGAVRFTSRDMKTDEDGILFSYCLDDQFFVNGGASNNCYNVIQKLGHDLGIDIWNMEREEYDALHASADGLFYLPWLFGERAPFQIYRSLSGFVNKKEFHTPVQLLKCSIECILFNMKLIVEKLQKLNSKDFNCLHLGGGFSDFPRIKELVSSIFNLPVVMHYSNESSALGTAYFTAKQLGIVSGYDDVINWNPVIKEHHPETNDAEAYLKSYNQFVSIARDAVRDE